MPRDAARLGQSCGGYLIVSLLGSGGVAEVYKAIHQETGAVVALKCLRVCHGSNHYIKEHMIAEGTLLSGLRHANVVRVIDVGIDNGILWIAMELLSGMTLRALLKASGALPIATALYYAREIADGVAAVHEMRVIHRDLKPENVMITDQNEVKVLDMGAAKFMGWDIRKTQTGAIYGTPLYMSPEHVLGEPLDARADVYSLGLILYEIIAGRHPFVAANGKALGQYEVCNKQRHVTPPPLASFIEGCPEIVSELVQKAIAKDRSQRPSSMPELAQMVRLTLKRAVTLGSRLPSLPEISVKAQRVDEACAAGEDDAPTEEDDGVDDNEVTQIFRRAAAPQSPLDTVIVSIQKSAPRPALAAERPAMTANGTEVMWVNGPPQSPVIPAPTTAASFSWDELFSATSTPQLKLNRLMEGLFRVLLGSALIALLLLFAHARLASISSPEIPPRAEALSPLTIGR